jgi:hypothetical protein
VVPSKNFFQVAEQCGNLSTCSDARPETKTFSKYLTENKTPVKPILKGKWNAVRVTLMIWS